MKTLLTLFLTLLLSNVLHAQVQVPKLNSYPSAAATIYLDFDGQYVTGTAWNWGGPINALPPNITQESMTEIFNRVAEDYRIFNINITTDSNIYKAAPIFQRTRVIVTPSNQWYGNAGGISYVGSFIWGDNTPAWVFSNLLGNNIKYIAEACSHEAGHTLGLQHQSSYNSTCGKIAEYNSGQGSGQIGWAPIMGVGYYRNLTTWYNGPSTMGCNELQNDIEVIAGPDNGFGLRTDDHANTYQLASDILTAPSFSVSGIVNNSGDADVFRLSLTYAQNFKLTAIPQNVGADNSGADVDIQVSLLDETGDTIGRYNPSLLLNAGIDTNLERGTYYVVAEGISNMYLGDYGSVGYYYLNGELNRVLPVERFRLSGSAANGIHALNWSYVTSVDIARFDVEVSADGSRFDKLVTLLPTQLNMNYTPLPAQRLYYRIKGITADERYYYSNIISLQPGQGKPVQVLNSFVKSSVGVNSTGRYNYQLFTENGQLVQSGNLQPGYNNISLRAGANGLLVMRIFDGNQYWSEKLIRQ
jgi:hypothetical protein